MSICLIATNPRCRIVESDVVSIPITAITCTNGVVFEFSLCLYRAYLGKRIIFMFNSISYPGRLMLFARR
jgi:hypothetical protein